MLTPEKPLHTRSPCTAMLLDVLCLVMYAAPGIDGPDLC